MPSVLAPMAAVTNCHNLRGLKQHIFIILQSGCQKSKMKVWVGLCPSESCTREFVSLSFSASRGFLQLESQHQKSSDLLAFLHSLLLIRTPVSIGPTHTALDNCLNSCN